MHGHSIANCLSILSSALVVRLVKRATVTNLRITLKLDGIFSYFPTRPLTLEEIQGYDEIKHVFLSPDTETWDPNSETYALNEEQIVDSVSDIVYPPPAAREVFEHMEVEEVRTEPLDNTVEKVSAYDKFVDEVISSSSVVLYFPQSIERSVITDPIRAQVASISTNLDPEFLSKS